MFFFFLISGLFLGWSLGANDAANVYGTAVGTRMIRFRVAAFFCSLFVLIGAVLGGAGAAHTLGELGAVNALPGSFTVALAAAVTVTWMTRLKLPVSTSQAVVGAIVGWNLFSGTLTDYASLTKILGSWILCPVLAAVFAFGMRKVVMAAMGRIRVHLFRVDSFTRYGLFLAGAFASYSLGANNIANVMGVFVPAAPFAPLHLGVITLSPGQQLFFLGALAIGVGVFSYSKRVMLTVGSELFRMSPVAALVVVLAQAIVLFLFASEGLEHWLVTRGLPAIPLVPVSSSQAVIGAVIGVGLAKGAQNIRYRVLGRIAWGWVSTPIAAAVLSFVMLFVVQNVFSQQVYSPVSFELSQDVMEKLRRERLYRPRLADLQDDRFDRASTLREALAERLPDHPDVDRVVELAQVHVIEIDVSRLAPYYDFSWYTREQLAAVRELAGKRFHHAWQLHDALVTMSPTWRFRPATRRNRLYNADLRRKVANLQRIFEAASQP